MGVFLGAKFIKKGEAVDPAVANVSISGLAEKLMNPHMALGGQAISIRGLERISAGGISDPSSLNRAPGLT